MSAGVSISSTSTYATLGCRSVGHAVAEELTDEGKDVLILDKDEGRVETLYDQDLNAQTTNTADPELADAVVGRDVTLILSSDIKANKATVSTIRGRDEDQFIVVRASDPVSEDGLTKLGTDVVINPSEVIADSAFRSVESGKLEYKARQLADILRDTDHGMTIFIHDNPDPDSLASAVTLQAIAREYDVEADILYSGDTDHQENRAFVNILGIELTPQSDLKPLQEYGAVALVDHMKSGMPDLGDANIMAFIDHFESDDGIDARFTDVRPNISSTSTIFTKYIQEFDLNPSQAMATALLYGIRAETLDFKRDTTPADLTATAYLYPLADHDTPEKVESPSMSPETLDVLAEVIQNRDVQGSHLVSNVGFIRNRDALTQTAQHLLNLEDITTMAVFGIADDTIYLATRSEDIRMNIGEVLNDAFIGIGEAGGHSTQGSVEIPLGIFTGIESNDDNRDMLLQLTEEAVKHKLFRVMGVGGSESGNGS